MSFEIDKSYYAVFFSGNKLWVYLFKKYYGLHNGIGFEGMISDTTYKFQEEIYYIYEDLKLSKYYYSGLASNINIIGLNIKEFGFKNFMTDYNKAKKDYIIRNIIE